MVQLDIVSTDLRLRRNVKKHKEFTWPENQTYMWKTTTTSLLHVDKKDLVAQGIQLKSADAAMRFETRPK